MNFDLKGNPLPYGIVTMSVSDFISEFTAYPDTIHRHNLVQKYDKYNQRVSSISPQFWNQLIGGSFTTQKQLPNDIDIVNIVSDEAILKIEDDMCMLKVNMNSKIAFGMDAYFIPTLPHF